MTALVTQRTAIGMKMSNFQMRFSIMFEYLSAAMPALDEV